jgi:organic radical activating enzyme
MNVHSIFESISGEAGISIPQGAWTTFIRLQGCNLRCPYCDTKDTQDVTIIRQELTIKQIIRKIHTKNVLITGGEPLLQRVGLEELIALLEANNHTVQIETNGSKCLPHNAFGCYGAWVIDYKLPSSGMMERMLPIDLFVAELNSLYAIVKFVIDIGADGLEVCDFNMMIGKIYEMIKLKYEGDFIISPVDAKPESMKRLVNMCSVAVPAEIRSRLIFSLQIHKICGLA